MPEHPHPHRSTTFLRPATVVPVLGAALTVVIAVSFGSAFEEAASFGLVVASGGGLALASVAWQLGPRAPVPAIVAATSFATGLLMACHAYGRLQGHPPAQVLAGMCVVLTALGLAAVVSSALDLARTRRRLARRPPHEASSTTAARPDAQGAGR